MRTASDTTTKLANAGAATGAAMLAGFAVAAAAAAKFDKALSNVRAVTGASTADMAKLRAAALDAGKTSVFTATEAANAEAELARAGVSTANIIGGALTGSLALAASGQVDLSEAATLSAQAMNTFGLQGKDVGHIADLLAAGANKSAADVHGLGTALRQGGLTRVRPRYSRPPRRRTQRPSSPARASAPPTSSAVRSQARSHWPHPGRSTCPRRPPCPRRR
ncbi:phage tail tape measure protein [Streptomyces sp. OR43]|uniref:phage tail tape measure protein n=1 Tax=Streptomyces sp. or43 TaxID=2478957 RepID=UPI0016512FB8|nr:phage tail tape measure protein [Streptomyces sp. or43]